MLNYVIRTPKQTKLEYLGLIHEDLCDTKQNLIPWKRKQKTKITVWVRNF